jgi:hypothetical protein
MPAPPRGIRVGAAWTVAGWRNWIVTVRTKKPPEAQGRRGGHRSPDLGPGDRRGELIALSSAREWPGSERDRRVEPWRNLIKKFTRKPPRDTRGG